MMSRTQLSLDPETHERARRRAADLRISLSEYLRQLVVTDLADRRPPVGPAAVFDMGDSGGSDVARYKDRYLAEATLAAAE